MKRYVVLLLLASLLPFIASSQAPVGFNYQAAIYQDGAPVANRSVDLRLDLVDQDGEIYYQEFAKGVQTDAVGLVNVLIGQSDPEKMASVPWGKGMWVSAYVNLGSGDVPLGRVKLQAVPYALHASAGMTIQAPEGYSADAPIFQVLDKKGNPILKITENETIISVLPQDDAAPVALAGARGVRGGFIVQTRGGGNHLPVNRMSVGDGVEFNVEDGSRGVRGGFIVNSRTRVSGRGGDTYTQIAPRLNIAQGSVNIFVEESGFGQDRAGGLRGGFIVNLNSQRYRSGDSELSYGASRPLMFLGQRESFLTIGKSTSTSCDGEVNSTFTLRDRCAPSETVIMQVTNEGRIQTANTQKEIQDVSFTPVSYSYSTSGQAFFTRFSRWWTPEQNVSVKEGGTVKGQLTSGYRIEVDDQHKQYFDVVQVKVPRENNKIGSALGLRIKPEKLKTMNFDTDLRDAIITIVSEIDPGCQTTVQVSGSIVDNLVNGSSGVFPVAAGSVLMQHEPGKDYEARIDVLNLSALTVLNEGLDVIEQDVEQPGPGVDVKIALGTVPYSHELALLLTCKRADVKAKMPNTMFDQPDEFTNDFKMKVRDKTTGATGVINFRIRKPQD